MVYLASEDLKNKTYYRHITSLALPDNIIEEVLDQALTYLAACPKRTANIKTFCADCLPHANRYEIRHIIRNYGIQRGIHWDGSNQADNFHTDKINPDRIGNEECLLQLIKKQGTKGMRFHELVYSFHRQSTYLVRRYLNNLVNDGKILHKEQSLYAETELTLKELGEAKLKKILTSCQSVIDRASERGLLVEADSFRYEVNSISEKDPYSKPFITNLVRQFGPANGMCFATKGNIFARDGLEIPYASMRELFCEVCKSTESTPHCRRKIAGIIEVTNHEFNRAYGIWRSRGTYDDESTTCE